MDPMYMDGHRVYRLPKRWSRSYKIGPPMDKSYEYTNHDKLMNQKCGTILAIIILTFVIAVAMVLAIVFSVKAQDTIKVNTATLEADFYLPDANYVPDYADSSSQAFQSFSSQFCDTIDEAMRMETGYQSCEVLKIRSGSLFLDVILTFVEDLVNSFSQSNANGIVDRSVNELRGNSEYGEVAGNGVWQQDSLDDDNRQDATTARTTTITTTTSRTTTITVQKEISTQMETTTDPDTSTQMGTTKTVDPETSTQMDTTRTVEPETSTQMETTTVEAETSTQMETTTEAETSTQMNTTRTVEPETSTQIETTTTKVETSTQMETTTEAETSTQMETTTTEAEISTQMETTTTEADTSTAPAEAVAAIWGVWTEWGDCDVACGSGFKQRNRTCEQGECVGTDMQSDTCNKALCARAVADYNVWSKWGTWAACGTTCGDSTQRRERDCGTDTNKLDCLGDSFQERTCNLGECPDCSLPCAGLWDTDCLVCECSGTTVTGRVTTLRGGPLDSVVITSLDKTYVNLTVTGANGGYVLTDVCTGQALLFTRPGYQSKTTTLAGESTLNLSLGKIVPLSITQQSNNIGRLTGNCLELECKVIGYPPPDNHEWFKDGLLIPNEIASTLSITSVTPADSGFYRCRANNDYGAALSDEIKLIVKDDEHEFCQKIPTSRPQSLPEGCKYNDQTEIDVGSCARGLCSKGGESTCSESSKYECGVISKDVVYANCPSNNLTIHIVKECGCIEKEDPYLELLGVVKDSKTGSTIEGITITTDKISTNTSDLGEFMLSLQPGLNRITIDLTDPLDRYVQQIDNINFGQNSFGTIEHNIRMTPKAEPMIVPASDEILVELGTNNGGQPAFGDIIIPQNSIYDAEGNIVTDNVQLNVDVYDPRENQAEANPPGDFSSIGEDGQENRLISTGMMRLGAKDTAGNDLNIGGEVEILLDESMVGNGSDIDNLKLWELDPTTGRWNYKADVNAQSSTRRRKRYIYTTRVRGIDIDNQWWNFDYLSDQICHTKIRVYQSNSFYTNEQLVKADVMVITLPSSSSSGTSLTRVRSNTDDTTDVNGYCIVHPCNSPRSSTTHDYHGYILADYKGAELIPADDTFDSAMDYRIEGNKIHVNFDYFAGADGPYYDWDYYWSSSSQCSNAPATDLHFRFYKDDAANCTIVDFTVLPTFVLPTPDIQNYYSWFISGPSLQYSACYIKVVTSWDSVSKIEASSSVGYAENDVLPTGDAFGARQACTENQTACLEVRSPFGITDGVTTYIGHTTVTIKVINGNPMSYSASPSLLSTGDVTFNDDASVVDILLRNTNGLYGSAYGVYCVETSESFVQAQRKAENACRRGSSTSAGQGIQQPPMVEGGWAISFHNYFVTAVPPTGRCPGGYTPSDACWGLTDVNTPYEYCTDEHFTCRTCDVTHFEPEFPNIIGTCDDTDRELEYNGCCPKLPLCPSGYKPHDTCRDSDITTPRPIQKPSRQYQYCTDEEYVCYTCDVTGSVPEFPIDEGNCTNPDHKLEYAGCCPKFPLCPGGNNPYGLCNTTDSDDILYSYRYCTEEGYICEACTGWNEYEYIYFDNSYQDFDQIIPKHPNSNGMCDDPDWIKGYQGCCPGCPSGRITYRQCDDTTNISDNEYCTDSGVVCDSCEVFFTIPERKNTNGSCANTNLVPVWQGCCPPIPLCPNGNWPSTSCNISTDCKSSSEYCTSGRVCCEGCPVTHVPPEPATDDRRCNNTDLVYNWQGCCPTVPLCMNGKEPSRLCQIDSDCYYDDIEYCFENQTCCNTCPFTHAHPEPFTDLGTCNNTNLEVREQGCCPVTKKCANGYEGSRTCQNDTDCFTFSIFTFSEYCTDDNICCQRCPVSKIPPEPTINNSCVDSDHDVSYLGCCPKYSMCPNGNEPSSFCKNDTCALDTEYCIAGVCCRRCPVSLAIPEPINDNKTCSNTSNRVSESGCCPQYPKCLDLYDPSGYCNITADCKSSHEYCTADNVCCYSCPESEVTPEVSYNNVSCNSTDYELISDTLCCPPVSTCPSGLNTQIFFCGEPLFSDYCRYLNGYCRDGLFCCYLCPNSNIEPDYPYANGTCPDSSYVFMEDYGCCPPGEDQDIIPA